MKNRQEYRDICVIVVNVELAKTTAQRPKLQGVLWKISYQETKHFLSLKTLPHEFWKLFLER